MSTPEREQIETVMRQTSDAIALARQGLDKLRAGLEAVTTDERTVQLADGLDLIRQSRLPGIDLPEEKVIDELVSERERIAPTSKTDGDDAILEEVTR